MKFLSVARDRRRLALAVTAAAAIAGGTCIGVAVAAQQRPPSPPAETAQAPVVTQPVPSATAPAATAPEISTPPTSPPATTAAAPPAGISIPAIGVHASFVQLGLAPDGSIEVPSDVTHVGWYRLGPAPGQLGPAVVLGHIDSAHSGPGVFFNLGALSPGDEVQVTRTDRRTVTFTVYAVREYPKDQFPTLTVYGNTADPQLRLITCGGSFDHATGHYRSNIVVFAREATR